MKRRFFLSLLLCTRVMAVIPDDSTQMPQGENRAQDYKKLDLLIGRGQWHQLVALEEFLRTKVSHTKLQNLQKQCEDRQKVVDCVYTCHKSPALCAQLMHINAAIAAMPQNTKEEIDELMRQGKGFVPNVDLFFEQERERIAAQWPWQRDFLYEQALEIRAFEETSLWREHVPLILEQRAQCQTLAQLHHTTFDQEVEAFYGAEKEGLQQFCHLLSRIQEECWEYYYVFDRNHFISTEIRRKSIPPGEPHNEMETFHAIVYQ